MGKSGINKKRMDSGSEFKTGKGNGDKKGKCGGVKANKKGYC